MFVENLEYKHTLANGDSPSETNHSMETNVLIL